MTRINVVPPSELCDQHLFAEFRELTRIPNCIAKGRYSLKDQPQQYTLGTGHVKFFYDKLLWLQRRYGSLEEELLARGWNITNIWPEDVQHLTHLWNDYEVTPEALQINRERIQIRMPAKARFTPRNNNG